MFYIVRFVICCVFLGFEILIIKRSKSMHKRLHYIVSVIVSTILLVVLAFSPFENLFITFDSPQKVYEYIYFEKSNVKLVVNGDDSDFVIGNENNSDIYLIVPKTTSGWKIGIGANTKRIVQKISNGITIYVYQYKNTNDYFITILDTNGGTSKIVDNYNSKYYSLEKNNRSLGKNFVTYYAHISDADSRYWVDVNGNKIKPLS